MTPPDEPTLLADLDAALAGDARALERLLAALKNPLFRLALRLLGNFADAEDATQEILVKIMTALASFERRSSIRTWAFRIALNHVRDFAASRRASTNPSLEAIAEQLDRGIAATPGYRHGAASPDPALELEAREVGLHCLQGILLCLDVDQRAAYVLCEVLDFDTRTAAQIESVSEAALRQRLSRARRRLETFLGERCGLVGENAACTCTRQAQALRLARGGRSLSIKFARGDAAETWRRFEQARAELSRLQRIGLAFRSHPDWTAPERLFEQVREAIRASPLVRGSAPPVNS